jgi:hypothetical protein
MARLRAAETPAFPCRMRRMRGSRRVATTAAVPSCEPSSTTTISHSGVVWASTLSSVVPMNRATS